MTKKNDWDAIARASGGTGRAGPSGPRREGTAAGKAGGPGEDTQGWAKLDNGQKLNMLTSEALDTQRDLLALGLRPIFAWRPANV